MYGKADELIEQARRRKAEGKPLTIEQNLLLALADGHWHSAKQLSVVVSHRFGAYLYDLKKKGVEYEKRRDPYAPKGKSWWKYRLAREEQYRPPMEYVDEAISRFERTLDMLESGTLTYDDFKDEPEDLYADLTYIYYYTDVYEALYDAYDALRDLRDVWAQQVFGPGVVDFDAMKPYWDKASASVERARTCYYGIFGERARAYDSYFQSLHEEVSDDE